MMNMEPKSKMESLLELVKEMKRLQGEQAGHTHNMEVEIHAQKLDPQELEHQEEVQHQDLDNDQEMGESPEHKALVLGDDESMESPEDLQDDEGSDDQSEMEIPPGLLKLLAEKLHK